MESARQKRSGRKSAGAYHHGDLRAALVAAATTLVEQSGTAGVSLREAARLAGVSAAAPYRHFPNKETLLAAVSAGAFKRLADELEDARRRSRAGRTRLRRMARRYVAFAVESPGAYRLMFGGAGPRASEHPELADAVAPALALVLEEISRAQDVGHLRPGSPEEIVTTVLALLHGMASFASEGQLPSWAEGPLESRVDRGVDALLRGFAPA